MHCPAHSLPTASTLFGLRRRRLPQLHLLTTYNLHSVNSPRKGPFNSIKFHIELPGQLLNSTQNLRLNELCCSLLFMGYFVFFRFSHSSE